MTGWDGVDPARIERLAAFRQRFPRREVEAAGRVFGYRVAGDGDRVMVWLVGAARCGDVWHRIVDRFPGARVVMPTWPALDSVEQATAGLEAILAREGVGAFDLLGQSFGGMVAQHVVRVWPDRVRSLALVTTAAPSLDAHPEQRPKWVRRHRVGRLLLSPVPTAVVRRGVLNRISGYLDGAAEDDRRFWTAFFGEFLAPASRAELLGIPARAIPRYFLNHRYTPGDLAGWGGRVLILDATNDSEMDAADQAELARLYPGAERHLLHGEDHLGPLLRADDKAALLQAFYGA